MSHCVLLVVDVQTALIKEHPYNVEIFIENLKTLIDMARYSNIEVVYLRHDDGIGTELEYGSDGWQIYYEISPNNNEMIFDKKFNSAFLKTGLKEYLESRKIDTIILVGLQTEYCIDATLKSAFENGFNVVIPENSNSTFDNEYLSGEKLYEFYNLKIWNHRFAKVLGVNEVSQLILKK